MSNAASIVSLIVGLLAIFGAIWKVQKLIDNIEDAVTELRHQHALMISDLDHKVDINTMTANGYREQIIHNHERHKREEDKINARIDINSVIIDDLESFIQKTTQYEKRHHR